MKKIYNRIREKVKQLLCRDHHWTKHIIYSLASRPTLYVCKKCGTAKLERQNIQSFYKA